MFSQLFRTTPASKTDSLQIGSRSVPLLFVHNPKARRYLLRLRSDGVARVTVPKRGSIPTAREFVGKNIGWLERQIQRLEAQPKTANEWRLGTEIYFRGQLVKIEIETARAKAGEFHVNSQGSGVYNSFGCGWIISNDASGLKFSPLVPILK